jgi:hypothetical protein
VLLVAPSPDWVAKLPFGKIPDRNDFKHLKDAERQRYWRQVTAETARLGDAFLAAVDGGQIASQLTAF